MASNSRRRTADGGWEPGNSLFVTVNCWGKLVTGVGAALGKGAPVIVVGHVYTSEYEDRDGNRRSSLEMRATSVGPGPVARASCASRSPATPVPTPARPRAARPPAKPSDAAGEDADWPMTTRSAPADDAEQPPRPYAPEPRLGRWAGCRAMPRMVREITSQTRKA